MHMIFSPDAEYCALSFNMDIVYFFHICMYQYVLSHEQGKIVFFLSPGTVFARAVLQFQVWLKKYICISKYWESLASFLNFYLEKLKNKELCQ